MNGKLIPDALLLNIAGKFKGISFQILESKYYRDEVSVLVRGEVRTGIFSKLIEEEWVQINLKELAKQFCLEKYGILPDEESVEFKREYIRAKLVGTRYAVGLAKKRIENRFAGKEFREAMEKTLEEVELLNIYTTSDRVKELYEKRRHTEEYLERVREKYPKVYEEIKKRFIVPEHVNFRTEEQSAKIHALVRELGMSEKKYRELLQKEFGVSSSVALTRSEASRLISILEEMVELQRATKQLSDSF